MVVLKLQRLDGDVFPKTHEHGCDINIPRIGMVSLTMLMSRLVPDMVIKLHKRQIE